MQLETPAATPTPIAPVSFSFVEILTSLTYRALGISLGAALVVLGSAMLLEP